MMGNGKMNWRGSWGGGGGRQYLASWPREAETVREDRAAPEVAKRPCRVAPPAASALR
jgi:hypothetical protein